MAVITQAFTPTTGAIIFASDTQRIVGDLYTLQNGNINSANIATSGVGTPNLENSGVTEPKCENTIFLWHEAMGG